MYAESFPNSIDLIVLLCSARMLVLVCCLDYRTASLEATTSSGASSVRPGKRAPLRLSDNLARAELEAERVQNLFSLEIPSISCVGVGVGVESELVSVELSRS